MFSSAYLTPNETMPDFRHRLDALEDAMLETDGRILVGGDCNAKALEWGMSHKDVSFAESLVSLVGGWRVREDFHQCSTNSRCARGEHREVCRNSWNKWGRAAGYNWGQWQRLYRKFSYEPDNDGLR